MIPRSPCPDGESLRLVLSTIHALGKSRVTSREVLAWDAREELPEELLRYVLGPEVALPLAFLPEEVGGLGGGAEMLCQVSEALARLDLSLATSVLAVALGCDPLRVGGTPAQRQQWLGQVAERGLIVAYCVTEPEAGSDVQALRTSAVPDLDETGRLHGYRLAGVKQFISNGGLADLYMVLARAPGGPSFFVVEGDAPGLGRGQAEHKHGLRAANTAQVILDGVWVPADHLVGLVEGQGLKQAGQVFGYTRLMVAALALGAGETALGLALGYAKQRVQFGKPLCQHRGYSHTLLVPHRVRLWASRAYIEELCARLDRGEEGLGTEGAVAKLYASEAANAAADAALQALGGYGYMRDFLVEKVRRDLRVTTLYEGTSEILRSLVFVMRAKQQLRSKGGFYGEEADRLRELGPEVSGGLLADMTRALGLAFDRAAQHRVSRLGEAQQALAAQVAAVEHAAALGRKAAQGGSAVLEAAARVNAAETAADLGRAVLRLMASSARVPEALVQSFEVAIGDFHLMGRRSGGQADRDAIMEALLADSV